MLIDNVAVKGVACPNETVAIGLRFDEDGDQRRVHESSN